MSSVPQSTAEAKPTGVRLGTPAKIASHSGISVVDRFALQAACRHLQPYERVAHCLRTPVGSTVGVLHVPGRRSGVFKGLQTCGSVWMCPVCGAKISERRRVELAEVIALREAEGWRFLVATYTLRHQRSDDLGPVLAALLEARRRHRSGRWSAAYRALVAASVRALEVTYGLNGWHPHLHDLMAIPPRPYLDEISLAEDLRSRWKICAEKQGGKFAVNEHGFRLSSDPARVAEYLTKVGHESGWTLAHEMTKQVVKRGHENSRTPTDLLWDFLSGDDQAGQLWREYANRFKGQNQLVWSLGGRARLGLVPEISDEELAAEITDQAVLLALLNLDQWRVIVGNDLRGELLQIAGRGDPAEIESWLAGVLA